MKLRTNQLLILALTLALLFSGACAPKGSADKNPDAPAKQEGLTLGEVPAPVQKTIQEQMGSGVLVGFTAEKEKGQTLYEAELRVAGRARNLLVDASGGLVEVETELALTELEAKLQAEIQKTVGKSKIVMLESVTKNNKLEGYELLVQDAKGKESEMVLTVTGKLKPKGGEDEEEDEDDEAERGK